MAGRRLHVDVRFTFEEGDAEPDGYVPMALTRIERTRSDLSDQVASGVAEHWAQSDFYGVRVQSDVIDVVAGDGAVDYPDERPM